MMNHFSYYLVFVMKIFSKFTKKICFHTVSWAAERASGL